MQITTYAAQVLRSLPHIVAATSILGGGALRAFYDGTAVKDFDLFFASDEHYQGALIAMLANHAFDYEGSAGRTEIFRCRMTGRVFNLVGFCYGDATAQMERFDFRCCRMVAYLADGDVVFRADPDAVADAQAKRLVVLCNNGAERTERRVQHYIHDYGYALDTSVDGHLEPEAPLPLPTTSEMDPKDFMRRYLARVPAGTGGY